MRILEPASKDAMRLLMQGSYALSIMEGNGMPVSESAIDAAEKDMNSRIAEIETNLRADDIFLAQRRRYGKNCSLGSREQLAHVLYKEMKLPGAKKSPKSGKYVMDDDVLEALENEHDIDYISNFRQLQGLKKVRDTYIRGLRTYLNNGRIHGEFMLNTVKTYRSSAKDPNLTTMPSRDPEQAAYIKRCFVPRDGWRIVEIDFSSLEVRIGCCYHKDPTMMEYLDKDYDMHSDISKQCYRFTDEEWKEQDKTKTKVLRSAAKGDAVFGWQYGNYYVDVCSRLWKTAKRQDLMDHLQTKGIKRFGLERDPQTDKWVEHHGNDSFVTHIKSVEEDFWGRRFKVYDQWRRKFYAQYLKHGYFQTKTGFLWHGVEKRNFVINCPIQGSAFHCLLESIIRVQKQITKRRMESLLICEIHDSLLAEVPENEVDDYVEMATGIMSQEIPNDWDWIITPLPVEVETSATSWYDKKPFHKE